MEWRLYCIIMDTRHGFTWVCGIILLCTAWIGLNSTCGCTLNFCFVDPQWLPWLQQRHHQKLENKTINFSLYGLPLFQRSANPVVDPLIVTCWLYFCNQTNPIYLTLSTLAVVALIIAFTLFYKNTHPVMIPPMHPKFIMPWKKLLICWEVSFDTRAGCLAPAFRCWYHGVAKPKHAPTMYITPFSNQQNAASWSACGARWRQRNETGLDKPTGRRGQLFVDQPVIWRWQPGVQLWCLTKTGSRVVDAGSKSYFIPIPLEKAGEKQDEDQLELPIPHEILMNLMGPVLKIHCHQTNKKLFDKHRSRNRTQLKGQYFGHTIKEGTSPSYFATVSAAIVGFDKIAQYYSQTWRPFIKKLQDEGLSSVGAPLCFVLPATMKKNRPTWQLPYPYWPRWASASWTSVSHQYQTRLCRLLWRPWPKTAFGTLWSGWLSQRSGLWSIGACNRRIRNRPAHEKDPARVADKIYYYTAEKKKRTQLSRFSKHAGHLSTAQYLKFILAIVGTVILVITLFYSNYLARNLEENELKNAAL